MKDTLFMGIDGGGSTLRVVIVNADLVPLSSITGESANPNLIGHDAAQAAIRRTIAAALQEACLQQRDIAAVAIGIAGASKLHSQDWLLQTVKPALPSSLIVPSSDLEIALVGALAQRHGILLLAGTGSAVFGITQSRQCLQIGGWGYLLGDEGSGYWIGLQILQHILKLHDKGAPVLDDMLSRRCLETIGVTKPRDLIAWLYRGREAPAARVASLAIIGLEMATEGDELAENILEAAVLELVGQADLMRSRLKWPEAPIAFAGGLLDNDNLLSEKVARKLGLLERPVAKYSPVVGAALLAQMEWSPADTK